SAPRHAGTDSLEASVVTAIVLVRAEIQRIPEVAEEIAQLPEVSEVYSVTGEFDLVAMVRVRAHDELADVIPGRLNKVPGVTHTETHIAFRTYSRHDLDAAQHRAGHFGVPRGVAAAQVGERGRRQAERGRVELGLGHLTVVHHPHRGRAGRGQLVEAVLAPEHQGRAAPPGQHAGDDLA